MRGGGGVGCWAGSVSMRWGGDGVVVNPKRFSCNYVFIDHLPLVVKQLGSERAFNDKR